MSAAVKIIAFVLPNFNAGGAERVMITVANHLDRTRFKPVIIVFHDHGPLREAVAADIAITSLNSPRVRQGFLRLPQAVKDAGADLVISTMAHLNMAVLLAKPMMWDVPVVVREAITPSYFASNLAKRYVLSLGYYLLYPLARCILSPTQMVFDEMPGFFRSWPGKLRRIFNPVNVDFIQGAVDPALRSTLTRPDQRLFVGAGRLVDQKGFDLLIKALRPWRDRDDWRVIILGDGPDQVALQRLIDDHGLHQIKLAGFEPKPWRYFAVADAFVLPSRHEGLPNVALEALALGAPVISARSAGGIGEIAAAAGVNDVRLASDMEEFRQLMEQVTPHHGVFPRISLLPYSFSLAHVVASYEQVFSDILSQKA